MFLMKLKFPQTIKMKVHSLLIFALLSFVVGQDRKITSVFNPGCTNCSENTTLLYVKCVGASDSIHQLWDFTGHIPTVILAIAGVNSTLNITWNKDSIPIYFEMSEMPLYSFAIGLDKIYEYDDVNDNGHIDPKLPQHEYRLDQMVWYRNESTTTDEEAMVHVYGAINNDRNGRYGTIHIKLDLLPFRDYAMDLPHLIHTANSTLFDVSLVNLTTSREYNASRFAFHLLLVSTDSATKTMHYTMRKSLDDEHTPGVFEVIEIKTPPLYDGRDGGYLQFRPVGYLQPQRGVASSTVAHVSQFNRTRLPRHSTLKRFYDEFGRARLLVQDVVVSFGETGDGYYRQHNYTAWSFTIGYGTPPTEKFSLFIIMIITIGLGVPVLLALSGVVYVLRRKNRQTANRTRFVNED